MKNDSSQRYITAELINFQPARLKSIPGKEKIKTAKECKVKPFLNNSNVIRDNKIKLDKTYINSSKTEIQNSYACTRIQSYY